MIFISKNEKGEPKIDKILAMKPDDTMVTSRIQPVPVGSIRAVQPGRGKFSIGKIQVISCEKRTEHYKRTCMGRGVASSWGLEEARLEGFYTFDGLLLALTEYGLEWSDLYRIEFKKVG